MSNRLVPVLNIYITFSNKFLLNIYYNINDCVLNGAKLALLFITLFFRTTTSYDSNSTLYSKFLKLIYTYALPRIAQTVCTISFKFLNINFFGKVITYI